MLVLLEQELFIIHQPLQLTLTFEVTCHLTTEPFPYSLTREVVPEKFAHIDQTEYSAIKIRLFHYDTGYLLNIYVSISH